VAESKRVWTILARDFTGSDPTEVGLGELWGMYFPTEEAARKEIREYIEERRADMAGLYEEDTCSDWESFEPRAPGCDWVVEDAEGERLFEFEIRSLQEGEGGCQ
jgi:hypothetical protein